ncbi:MAG: hypothetical protein L0Y45_11105 [Woeseiaceae bacterium]|nr:hypothetical protein [Woeseiaceae bacterium]
MAKRPQRSISHAVPSEIICNAYAACETRPAAVNPERAEFLRRARAGMPESALLRADPIE